MANISVTLVSGATKLDNIPVPSGSTVASLAASYGDVLGIPADANVTINGSNATGTARVPAGAIVSWNKPTGSKG